jgi:hypothetical protein
MNNESFFMIDPNLNSESESNDIYLQYHFFDSTNIFYQVFLGSTCSIKFVYEDKVLLLRTLSSIEINTLNKKLKNLRIPKIEFIKEVKLPPTIPPCPNVMSKIYLHSNSLDISVSWTMEDEDNSPRKYNPFKNLGNYIHNLLPIGNLNIELPRFE